MSVNFNVASNTLTVIANSAINDLTIFTYTAWVLGRTQGGTSDGRVVHKGSTGTRKKLNYATATVNGLEATVDRATTPANAVSVNNVVPLGEWHFVAMTYSEADGPRIFVDGVETAYASRDVGTGATSADAAENLFIGNRGAGARGWDGFIEDVRLYDRRLGVNELLTLHATRGSDGIVPGLIARFPMNELAPGSAVVQCPSIGPNSMLAIPGSAQTYDISVLRGSSSSRTRGG
jgi:hypothetical protein